MAMTKADKLSNLPDAVVCHILSFLLTKHAAATSILSKRWTRLWLSVPTLDLVEKSNEELDINQSIQFLRMVYAIMLKRDVTHIKTFSLKFCGHTLCDASDVSTWINAAIQRGVEYLNLDLLPSIRLPSGIIGCKTLVHLCFFHLSINGVFVDGFPSLKVMDLMSIHFEQHRDLMHLLSGCPMLEDFCAEGLTLNNDHLISVQEFQILHKLVRVDVSFAAAYIPLRCLCNAKTLTLMEWFPYYEVACTFHNLTSLELMVGFYNLDWFLELLQHCPKLQKFKFVKIEDGDEDDEFGDQRWVQPQFVPRCLSSHLRTCDLENYEGFDSELLQFAKYIMQNAKVLCNMRISSDIFSNPKEKLKFIKKISSFPWSSSELHLNVDLCLP